MVNSAHIRRVTLELFDYCRKNDWAGFDPYDALNSRIFRALPFRRSPIARLALTQIVKRCPFNLRQLLLVPRKQNPKGIALFLSAFVRLRQAGLLGGDEDIRFMTDRLLALRSPHIRDMAWGYSFDWQTRSYLVPEGSPNIICTAFAANALLDAYEVFREERWLNAAIGSGEFILNGFFWRPDPSSACFSYTPIERSQVHNANLFGASLLCRVGSVSGNSRFFQPALEAARFSVSKQREDGSWYYGEAPSQRWIDNFHTGYNLVALKDISRFGRVNEFDAAVGRGFDFYREHFFREDGAPRYFHDRTYPIDIHSVAQSISTLIEFENLASDNKRLAESVLKWALANMRDGRGYFYFQKHRWYTNRIPFIRWSQAWMLLALSMFLDRNSRAGNEHAGEES
jgi:hypothetical protein